MCREKDQTLQCFGIIVNKYYYLICILSFGDVIYTCILYGVCLILEQNSVGKLESRTCMGKFYVYLKIKYSFFSHVFPRSDTSPTSL